MEKKYFPIFIDLSEKRIVVIGGGVIATRRVKTLLEFTKNITVVAPEITSELEQMADCGRITWITETYAVKCSTCNFLMQKSEMLYQEILCPFKSFSEDLDIMHIMPVQQKTSVSDIKSHPGNGVFKKTDFECSFHRIQEADIVIAATNDPKVNHQIQENCRFLEKLSGKSILVNVADDKNSCDFYFPSIVQKENMVIGINSGGQSPKITKEIRKKIEKCLDTSSIYSG